MIVTCELLLVMPSLPVSLSTYEPAVGKLAVVEALAALVKVVCPGPLTCAELDVRLWPGGIDASVTEPLSCSVPGKVTD